MQLRSMFDNARASESGLSSTMAMSISPPSFLMRAVLPQLFSHTFRQSESLGCSAECLEEAAVSHLWRRQGVTAEATRRRSLSRISFDVTYFM